MAKDVEITIKSNTEGAVQSIGDLKKFADRSFKDMEEAADKRAKFVTKAFRDMGIRTEEAIRKSTEKAKKDYERIKNSGTASANDIKRAHNRMTDKIKRNNEELVRGTLTLSGAFGKLKDPLRTAGKAAALFTTAIAAVGTVFGVKAFGESVKFESAVLDLQKVLGDTEGQASDFIDTATRLSNEFGVSATDVLAGATGFKQAGFEIKDAFDLQRIAIEQSIAGGISVEESSQRIINALKGFGVGAKEAGRLTDVLNEVSNKFGTNTQELAVGVARLSPIASAAGLSIEETAGFLTPIIEVFGSGSEAANALRTGFLKLVKPTAEASKKLEELGVATITQEGALRSSKDIAFELAEVYKGLSKEQQVQATATIFGNEQSAKLQKVFANLGTVTDVVNVAMNSAGSRVAEVAVRMSSAEVQIARAKEQFNNMARVLGDEFKDEVVGVIGQLGGLASKFKELVDQGGLEPLLDVLRPKLEDLQILIKRISDDVPGFVAGIAERVDSVLVLFDAVVKVFKTLRIGFLEISGAILDWGKVLGWVTDKLGLTELASETFTIAAQENEKAILKARGELEKAVDTTGEYVEANEGAIDTLNELEEELKRNDAAIEANIKKKQEAVDQTNKSADAIRKETQAKAENAAAFSEVPESAKIEGNMDFVGPLRPGTQMTNTKEVSSPEIEMPNAERMAGGAVSVSSGFKLPLFKEFLKLPQSEKELLARSRGMTVDELIKQIRRKMRTGGIIKAREGQLIPGGYGGGDKVPVLAEPGEFMVRKEAVRALGVNTIDSINRMDLSSAIDNIFKRGAQGLQEGGIVAESGASETVNVNLLMNEKSFPMKSSKGTAEALIENIGTVNIVHGRAKRPY